MSQLIAEHKRGVSSFIADQVKAWDTGQLVELIESNVDATFNLSASTAL
jgi:uncharacterized membrane-anchored protein YjiN (DUF445 family)